MNMPTPHHLRLVEALELHEPPQAELVILHAHGEALAWGYTEDQARLRALDVARRLGPDAVRLVRQATPLVVTVAQHQALDLLVLLGLVGTDGGGDDGPRCAA